MKKIVSIWVVFLLTIVSAEAAKGPRKFYLTQNAVKGSQALTACAEGYHMASLWEIFDISNLRYDTTLGQTSQDAGFGPPANEFGWIRTGTASSRNSGVPGLDNCYGWTSDSFPDFGSSVRLDFDWSNPTSGRIAPWDGSLLWFCNTDFSVWCVQD